MKLRIGDTVLVTGGKDRGKKGEIVFVSPKNNTVIVAGMNMYSRHVKPYGERAGEIVRRERPLPAGKVAILNEKGNRDRIGYTVAKDGTKQRVFRKTGTVITVKTSKSAKKAADKKAKKK